MEVIAAAGRPVDRKAVTHWGWGTPDGTRRGRRFANDSAIVVSMERYVNRVVAVSWLSGGSSNLKILLRRVAGLETHDLRGIDRQASTRILKVDLIGLAGMAFTTDNENEGLASFHGGRVQDGKGRILVDLTRGLVWVAGDTWCDRCGD